MKIYSLRHGQTELNKKKKVNGQIDEPLAAEGIQQAEITISSLPKTINYIYTSPMLRAKQTAEIINSKLKLPLFIRNEITEIHMGTLAGKSWDEMENGAELKKKHRTMQFDYRPQKGESIDGVKKRILAFLEEINGKYKDYEVLVVTHGGIIRLLHLLEHNSPLTEDIEHALLHTFNLDKILQ